MKAHDLCSPRGPRLGSHGCPVPDSAPTWPGRSKAHSQPIWRKTFDGLLPVAPREPSQPSTALSQLVFQVGDSFLKFSQSLIRAAVLESSRQTSASSTLVSSQGCCCWLRSVLAAEKSGWPWVFSVCLLLLTSSASTLKPHGLFSAVNPSRCDSRVRLASSGSFQRERLGLERNGRLLKIYLTVTFYMALL